jgi:acyl-CoA oxidase
MSAVGDSGVEQDRARSFPAASGEVVASLTRVLDGRWRAVRERSRSEVVDLLAPTPPGLDVAAHREIVLERVHRLAALGYPHLGFPKDLGGQADLGGSVTSFEMLGFGELSLMVKAGVQWGLFGGAVHALGTDRQHREYLPPIMAAELLGCFAMTETGHGSDVQSIHTTASYEPASGEFVVNTPDREARKDYIGNAARDGRLAVVFAQLSSGGEERGVHALLVPIRDDEGQVLPGITIGDDGIKAGLNGVDNGRLTFDHVRVPRAALLDRYGRVEADGTYYSPIKNPGRRFFTMLGTLVRGRISVAGAANSAAQAALTIAVRYGDRRRQFQRPAGPGAAGTDGAAGTVGAADTVPGLEEVPVLDYLAHQRRLLPALAKTYAVHFAQGELVSELHELQSGRADVIEQAGLRDEQRQRELEAKAAGIKAISTWHTTQTIQTCREACGGAGYLAENRLPQLKADTDVFTTFEGDNTVLLQLVAKGLLTSYRDHLGELDTLGMMRFLADQVIGTVVERTSARAVRDRIATATSGRDDDEDLLDRRWHLRLFADREEHVLEGAARRLRRARGSEAFAAFNAAQDHVLQAARAHIDRLLLEAFVAAIERCDDGSDGGARRLLTRVCDLFVLSTIEADRAWFLEHGRLSASRSKAVIRAVNDLCQELRPDAVALVDAFAIPEPWLAAQIITPPA